MAAEQIFMLLCRCCLLFLPHFYGRPCHLVFFPFRSLVGALNEVVIYEIWWTDLHYKASEAICAVHSCVKWLQTKYTPYTQKYNHIPIYNSLMETNNVIKTTIQLLVFSADFFFDSWRKKNQKKNGKFDVLVITCGKRGT